MALSLFSLTKTTPLDNDGNIVPGGLLNFYATGTAVRKDTYPDANAFGTNTNPVELDAAGRADIFLANDGGYDVVFTDADGNTIWTLTNVVSATSAAAGLAVAPVTATITTVGVQAALPIPVGDGDLVLFCNNATLLTIRGIAAGRDGQSLFIFSKGAGKIDIIDQSSSTAAPDRIITASQGTITLVDGKGRVQLVYDTLTARWRVLEHEQGDWIAVPFSAGDFTAAGAMTWTVASGDVLAFAYYLRGRDLQIAFVVNTTTVGGTPDTQLRVTVPAGYTIAARSDGPIAGLNNNVDLTSGLWFAGAGTTYVAFLVSYTSTNWTASTDQTTVSAVITVRV